MIVNAGYRGKVGAAVPKFTYTGQYNIRKDGVVELLTSGTLMFLSPALIDRFMVGGGAAGVSTTMTTSTTNGLGGGGGGYTRTDKNLQILANVQIPITIGAGGTRYANKDAFKAIPGGATSWGTDSVPGGDALTMNSLNVSSKGGNGGSGGGGGVTSNTDYGAGGSNGSNGERGYSGSKVPAGGTGQGTTTREFGEETGKLYAGGGGGGRYIASASFIASPGGSGGGGAGACRINVSPYTQEAGDGVANTGGGGGGCVLSNSVLLGGSGGSGIVCFRAAR